MQFIQKTPLIVSAFLFLGLSANEPMMPQMVIKTIQNNTPYTLRLTDRFNTNKALIIDAGQTLEANFEIIGSKNVIIQGSMRAILAEEAQFIIQKLDVAGNPVADNEAYLNLCTVPGGVNDGSGFITGTIGSIVFKFFMAGKQGGCLMSSGRLKNNSCNLIEINLVLNADESDVQNDVFRLYSEYSLNEK